MANKAIAEEMGIGEQAVKAHISRLFLKFRVESRAGLAVAALSQEIDERSTAVSELERLAREERRDALRTRAKLLGSLVGKDPAVVVDRDGRVLLANPAFQRTFAAALYQDESGVKLPADATPLARAAQGQLVARDGGNGRVRGPRRWSTGRVPPGPRPRQIEQLTSGCDPRRKA